MRDLLIWITESRSRDGRAVSQLDSALTGCRVSSPASGPPLISAATAAGALCEYFLASAERGDHVANDHFVTELVSRMRAQ